MKNDIHRFTLYVDLQRIRLLLADPLLEDLCERMLARVIQLENDLVEDRICVVIFGNGGQLAELLRGKGLYSGGQGADFFDTYKLSLRTAALNAYGSHDLSDRVDIAVFDVTDVTMVLSEVRNNKKVKCPQWLRTLYVIDKDQVTNVEAVGRKLSQRVSQGKGNGRACETLTYNPRECAQALKMMDDCVPALEELRAIKLRLLALSNEVFEERFQFLFVTEWLSILNECTQSLQSKADVHLQRKYELQAMRKCLDAKAVEWDASKLEIEMENFGVRVDDLTLPENPANIMEASSIINRTVRDRLNNVTGKEAVSMATTAIDEFVETIRYYIIEHTQSFSWLDDKKREEMENWLRNITPDRINFSCPSFSIDLSMQMSVSEYQDEASIRCAMKEDVREALQNYNVDLCAKLAKQIEEVKQKYLKKLGKFLNILYDSIDEASTQSQEAAAAIESSDVWTGLAALANGAKTLR